MPVSGNHLDVRTQLGGSASSIIAPSGPVPESRRQQFQALSDQLREGNPDQQRSAAQILRRFGRAAVEPLCAAVAAGPNAVRRAAAGTLGRIGDARAAAALKVLLGERPARRRLGWRRGLAQVSLTLSGLAVFAGAFAWLLEARLTGLLSLAAAVLCLVGFAVARPRLGLQVGTALDALQKLAERNCPLALVGRLRNLQATTQNIFGYDEALWDVVEDVARYLEDVAAGREPTEDPGWVKREVGDFQDPTVERKLRSIEKRVAAIYASAEDAAPETLHSALSDEEPRVQIAAANRLGEEKNPHSLEPLVRTLQDKNLLVRVAAAEALGQLEDERAIEPLQKTLKQGFIGKSARLQKLAGQLILLVACGMVWAFFFSHFSIVRSLGVMMFQLPLQFGVPWFQRRRQEGRLAQAAAESLAWIGEVRPSPRLRSVLHDLSVLAGDRLQQDALTRHACREAAGRIEAQTARLESLPVASHSPSESDTPLPIPVQEVSPPGRLLPRVSGRAERE